MKMFDKVVSYVDLTQIETSLSEIAASYHNRPIMSIKDVKQRQFEEMETLNRLGGVDLINHALGTNLEDFRYGMPFPNTLPGFKNIDQIAEDYRPVPNTFVENIFEIANIEKGDSYEDYIEKIGSGFDFRDIMGDNDFWESDEGVEILESERGLSLRANTFDDERYLDRLRRFHTMNLNIPGNIRKVLLYNTNKW